MPRSPASSISTRLASRRKLTRLVVPADAYTQLCVSFAKQSDDFLTLVRRVCKAAAKYGDYRLSDDLVIIVRSLNGHTEDMRETLRAILEEQPSESGGFDG